MEIEETFFLKNWNYIVEKFKKEMRITKGELLERMGYNPTTDFQWKKRKTIAKTTLRKIILFVNRELRWNINEDDLLKRDLSHGEIMRIGEINEEYLIAKEQEILDTFRTASPQEQEQILDFIRYLAQKKNRS